MILSEPSGWAKKVTPIGDQLTVGGTARQANEKPDHGVYLQTQQNPRYQESNHWPRSDKK